MSYVFKQNLVSSNKYSIKCPYTMTPEYIVVHNTSNDASAENEVKYMISNNNQVSFHYAVDDQYVIQGIPANRNAFHAGDGANGKGNRKGLSIEICYSKSGGSKFTAAEKNAAKFIASLLKERGWGIDKVKKHQDFSGKYCPHRTLDLGWQRFLNMVQAELNGTTTQQPAQSTSTSSSLAGSNFTVKIKVDSLNIRQSASFDSKVVGTVKKGEVYTIVQVKNGLGLLKSGAGWISMGTAYVEKVATVAAAPKTFKVRIKCASLNIRKSADFNSAVVGTVKKGEVYTITEEKNGLGHLKSGAGWISMGSSYVEKV